MNREELIKKAAKAMAYEDREPATWQWFLPDARRAFAVFEEAHTPTDAYGPGGKHENCYFMEHSCTPANVSEPGETDIPAAPMSLSGQIPTDDERKVIARVILPLFDELAAAVYGDGPYSEAESALEAADLLIAAGLHRTVQGEPSDVQVGRKVSQLADAWNATPDFAPTEYDRGRVDQRHDMTMQLLEVITADSTGGPETFAERKLRQSIEAMEAQKADSVRDRLTLIARDVHLFDGGGNQALSGPGARRIADVILSQFDVTLKAADRTNRSEGQGNG